MLLTNKKEGDFEDADDDQSVHVGKPKGISSKKRPKPQDFSFSKDVQPIKRRKTLK
ncbi:unnamed protein product [Hymenolepis diminuta]|uniref:Uncharacterized protein n=1 Tax=Hymenolepis diminuta TaxID=6216 RepID=A0A564XXB0_HYMDI|nr:unnamed protein product [Hymenolepis diminuta]